MEADGRLVEDVEHSDQSAADLRGQPDPLGLPAGQGGCRPGQGQVVETHVEEKTQSPPDLLKDLLGNHLLSVSEVETLESLGRLANG